jgi:hypothetical protein
MKHIHPVSFARVVGGKHLMTTDEFGTSIKENIIVSDELRTKIPYFYRH